MNAILTHSSEKSCFLSGGERQFLSDSSESRSLNVKSMTFIWCGAPLTHGLFLVSFVHVAHERASSIL